MESKTSSGQILIECALMLLWFAAFFTFVVEFNDDKNPREKSKQEIIRSKQELDFRKYRNGDRQ